MKRCILLILPLFLLAISSAAADLPPPSGYKYVVPRVRFEGIDEHPDYVFFLRYFAYHGNPAGVPHTLLPVTNEQPFNLPGGRRFQDMYLLVLERTEFEKRKQDDPTLKWLTESTPGILKFKLDTPKEEVSASLTDVPITIYRVSLEGRSLYVEMEEPSDRWWWLWASALAFVLALAGFGIRFARGHRRTVE